MNIRLGFEMVYDCPQPTPMIFNLNVHFSRVSDLAGRDDLSFDPPVPVSAFRDPFGNWCTRIVAPAGRLRVWSDVLIHDTGAPDETAPGAPQVAVQDLPEEALPFLLGSRYCETDQLSETAWRLFGAGPTGYDRVQAICDLVHGHITFGYENARMTRTALEAWREGVGVCRDYAHLAVAFCRCMNIPARYCTGYLGDMGTPPPYAPGDFAAWFEAYVGGRWYTFDPRNNTPRIGRILIARGRDAADVALASTFGPNTLASFRVVTDEVASFAVGIVPHPSPRGVLDSLTMTDVSDRIQYAVLSAFLGGCIAMAITWWTGASFDLHFFALFMGPAAVAGFLVGQPFHDALGQILHRIW